MLKNVIISLVIAGALSYLLFTTAEADASEVTTITINSMRE